MLQTFYSITSLFKKNRNFLVALNEKGKVVIGWFHQQMTMKIKRRLSPQGEKQWPPTWAWKGCFLTIKAKVPISAWTFYSMQISLFQGKTGNKHFSLLPLCPGGDSQAIIFWVLWMQVLLAFKARYFEGPFLQVELKVGEPDQKFGPNPFLLREKQGLMSFLPSVCLCTRDGVYSKSMSQPLLPVLLWNFSHLSNV